ncbi:unnamed protein product [Oncorhynchus mykiss]|uniref:Uncharacterized protein n=1 Tax=Oncorhynchus mykiss TaxID=8022 RepID=A0A060YK92_ONCMY|nr:unnamed protein product [Oncorhynchus mykiss]
MSLSEEGEQWTTASKMSLSGEHDSNSKAESPIQQKRPVSPVTSCVSMKSDQSMGHPVLFRKRDGSTKQSPIQQKRPVSPVTSCVSMKSDQSMGHPVLFRKRDGSTKQRYEKCITQVDHP